MKHHHIALVTIAGSLITAVILGLAYSAVTPGLPWWHGVYCALANAVTDGGDVQPVNKPGYAIQSAEFLTVVPLFVASFSLFTSAMSAVNQRASESRIKRHIELHSGTEGDAS